MQALRLIEDGRLQLEDLPEPGEPAAGEVIVRMRTVALNHIDLWGFRGMAFAKRQLPIVVGVEGAGEIAAVGAGVAERKPGDRVALYAGVICGYCPSCLRGQENLCENIALGGIMGFHRDGLRHAGGRCSRPVREGARRARRKDVTPGVPRAVPLQPSRASAPNRTRLGT